MVTLAADVSMTSTPAAVLDAVRQFDRPVSVLVNNAYSAADTTKTIFDVGESAWDQALATNVLGPFRLAQAVGRTMLEAGRGSIINLLSGSGFLPTPKLAVYGTTKAALWALTRYLALEGAPAVRANAICPGVISESGLPRSDSQRQLLQQVPMGRMGRPHEAAGAAVYLASDAASYTTGEVIFVNGGRPW